MKNRLRELRRQRGWTLAQVAEAVGTSPQTISRLETEVTTISSDWLERFAQLFEVPVAALFEAIGTKGIPFLGALDADGQVQAVQTGSDFDMRVPASRPVAARIGQAYGDYRAGEIIIGDRLDSDEIEAAFGYDCLVKTGPGTTLLLRRLARGDGAQPILIPLAQGKPPRHPRHLEWVAKIVMRIIYPAG